MAKPSDRSRANQLGKKPKRRRVIHSANPARRSAMDLELSTALELHRAGKIDEAQIRYNKILEQEPENADAWHLLGMTFFAQQQLGTALDCLAKADRFSPQNCFILANLGLVRRASGDLVGAVEDLQRAAALAPKSLDIRTNLGTVMLEQKNIDAAAKQFEFVLSMDADHEQAAMNLGNLRQSQQRFQDAESLYRRVIARHPNSALVHHNLGESLRNQGLWQAAADAFARAIELDSNSFESQLNLGRTLSNLSRVPESQQIFARLIKQDPSRGKSFHYLGKLLFEQGDLPAAASNIKQALQLSPQDEFAICSLGFVYLEMGETAEAECCFRRALAIDPEQVTAHSCLLFLMSGNPDLDQSTLFEEHQRWGIQHGAVSPLGSFRNSRDPQRRLRIGYVSPDFRRHAVAGFFRPVLEQHDPLRVETYCYAEVVAPDEVTASFQQLADHWRSTVGLSDGQVAGQVIADEIDILVDLAGHTAGNRLRVLAYRPAPIQVTWIGYPNTTGLSAIDYRLTCAVQNPVDEPTYHTEQLIRMPNGSFCFSAPSLAPSLGPPPIRRQGHVTFGSLHRPSKISADVRKLWANVLKANAESRLILFNTRFTDQSAALIRDDLVRLGIDSDRIEIRNQNCGESYLTVYDEIDIGLDVAPWAGGTTTMEALWMGVPVVALYGQRRSARSTAAIMSQVNLSDLIAYTETQYVSLATQLAQNVPRLELLRVELRPTLERTICNVERFTRDLEQEFQRMWTEWCCQ